jgi:hypothetical protein
MGMARDAAIVSTWSTPVPGREAKSLEVFSEFIGFIGKQAAEGKCQPAEPFFAADGSGGFAIVRGKSDALQEILDSKENQRLITKVQLLVQDAKVHLYYTGEEEIQRGTQIFAEVIGQL